MKSNIIQKKVSFDGITTHYHLTVSCLSCGKEFESGNVIAAKYCPDCSLRMKRELTRKRVAKCRHNKKLRENGYL